MIIVKHNIKGFAGFSKPVEFCFKMEPSIILGINGAGKSSLLNSIFASIEYCISLIHSFNMQEIGIITKAINIESKLSEVLSEFQIDESPKTYEIGYRLLQNGQVNLIGKGQNNLRNLLAELNQDFDSGILPVLRYFQSEKNVDTNNDLVSTQKFNKQENRRIGYDNLAFRGILIQEVTSFMINQINIENQAKVDNGDLNYETKVGVYLRTTLNQFTTILYGQEVEIKVKPSKFSSGQSIVVVKMDDELEFSQLSSGEKYIISLVLELIYRIVTLNPRINDFKLVNGIILIDEVENHLHPRWQLTIIKALKSCFPHFQFIVSSHSPLIASSVRKDQIIALSNFELIPNEELPDVFTGTSDELLDKVLHSGIQVDDFKSAKRKIENLINQFEFDAAEKEFEELKKLLNSNPQWLIDLESKISFGKA
jgi:predicted ATP-binding protein involved in virulence